METLTGVATTIDEWGWRTVGRAGYVGSRRGAAMAQRDAEFGVGGWRIAYAWEGAVIPREAALAIYTEAYVAHFRAHPEVLAWLVATASDVYDIEPRDVESGEDFHVQKAQATHLQDIAIRIAVRRLGERFRGERLVQVRSRRSEGARLNPGVVPFHAPEHIVAPPLSGWWGPGTIEDFWQSNKVLQARRRHTLVFGGSFNPIHEGHLAAARFARDALGFDRVVFLPNGDGYRKAGLAPAADRLAMVRAAVAGERGFEVDDSEVRSPAPLRNVTTLREIRAAAPDDALALYRGVDALRKTHRGLFDVEGLRVLVLDREGDPARFEAVVAAHEPLRRNRARLDYRAGAFAHAGSSTAVRAAVAAGQPLDGLVPPAVAACIAAAGLYRPAGARPGGGAGPQ